MIEYQYREALQQLVTAYCHTQRNTEEELPNWFYIVLDFMEVECQLRFSTVIGTWEDA